MARKVNTRTTQRARKNVRINPKAAAGGKYKPRRTTPKKRLGKRLGKRVQSPSGRGLAKRVVARRSTIKRTKGTARVSLPRTPVRRSRYQPKAQPSRATVAKQRLPAGLAQRIVSAVTQCRHRGGVTMAELKHVLADGLYDVTKNNKRVDATLKGLVARKVLLQTAGAKRGAGSYRLNKMNLAGQKKVKATAARTAKGTGPRAGKAIKPERKSTPARKSPRPARKSPRPASKSPRPASKSPKPARKSPRPASKSPKPARKSPRPARKSPRPARKSPRPARKSPTRGKKQAGKRQTMLATKARKQAARKGKTTGKARRSKSR